MIVVALSLLIVVINAVGQTLIKLAALKRDLVISRRLIILALGYSCSFMVVVLMILLLDFVAVSSLTLIIAVHFVVVTLIGRFFFNEGFSRGNWIGLALIVAGVLIGVT